MEDVFRALVLDYALSPPVIVEGVARPFVKSGCTVDYRPFYPNLVRTDLERYSLIVLLAGRTPAFPSGMMSVDEVQAAVGFVRNGGTLVLGPNLDGGEGANERYQFNRVLADLEVPIQICGDRIEDPENRYAASMWDRPLYRPAPGHPVSEGVEERLAFDRSTSLMAGEGATVLLSAFESARPRGAAPVIAMARSGDGLVLVAGRFLLSATGVPLRLSGEPLLHPEQLADTDVFLDRLAKHVVGLARGDVEWSCINPTPDRAMGEEDPPDFVLDRSPLLDDVPDGVRTVKLDPPSGELDPHDREAASEYEALPDERRYGWIRKEGIRASWGSAVQWRKPLESRTEVERVAGALEACDVNLFWGIANCQAAAGAGYTREERESVLERWEWTAQALDGSPVKWYPTLDYRFFRDEESRCIGAQGQVLEAPSPMDLSFWRRGWRDSLLAIAEFSRSHRGVGGIALDLELYGHPPAFNYYTGYGFEDACYAAALERLSAEGNEGWHREAAGVPERDRFDWLRTHGLLERYFEVLSEEVEAICRGIREDVWCVNPDLLFASYIFTTPVNWFDLGVYRGFCTPQRPIVLMTFNIRSGRMLEYLRAERVYAYHATVALLGMIGREEYATVFANAQCYGHGYWMNNINALLHADPESVESPARQGMSMDDAVGAIREANRAVLSGRESDGKGGPH
jgi:hypothetical protein